MTTTYEHKTELVGDDYPGLPTRPVQYRGARKHEGLPWDQITEQYQARGGQVDASVWPKTNGKVVLVGGNANSSRAHLHSFAEASEYDEPAAPKPARVKKPRARKTTTSVVPRIYQVQPEQRPEIARRYAAGESIPVLAKAYAVSEGSIRYAIQKAGGQTRSKKEAAALKFRTRS